MDSMVSNRSLEQMATRRDRSGSLWLVQAFSGLVLVILLGLHMIAHHYVVEGGLRNYQQVLDYVNNPVVFILQLLFLILGVSHGLLGTRAIIIDMRPSASALRVVNWVLIVIGVVAIIFGIYLSLALQRLAG